MATEQIRINYLVDKKQLDASNESLKKSAKANDLVQKEVDQTTDKFKKQDKQLAKTNKLFSGLGGQLTALGNRFQIAGKGVGDMAAGMFKATKATNVTSKAMKVLKFAIASTGIGLLVVALASLITYFTKTQKGSDLLSKAMGAIGATVDVIVGKIAKFGEKIVKVFSDPKKAIKDLANLIKDNIVNRFVGLIELIPALGTAINQLFKGDFAGAAETAGDAVIKVSLGVEGFTDKIKSGANAVKELATEIQGAVSDSNEYEDMLIRLREREIEVTSSVARRTKIIQEQLLATKNNTLSFVEQKKALDLVEKLQIENENELLDLAQQRLDLSKKDLANTPLELQMDEQRLEVAQAQAAFDSEIANSKARQRDTANRQTELANRMIAATKAQAAEESKIAKDKQDRIDAELESEATALAIKKQAISDLEIFTLESAGKLEEAELERRTRLLENEILTEEERQLIIAESEGKIKEIREASSAAAAQLSETELATKLEAAQFITSKIAAISSKESAAGKAAAIAQTTISTYQGAVAAQASLSSIPVVGPALGIIAAGLTITAGLQSVGKIAGVQLPKFEQGGRIGGNLHSGGGTMIEAERDEFIMSRKATSKYGFDIMSKINNLELSDITSVGNGSNVNIIDTNPIAEQLKNMPQNIMNVDSEGFALHQVRGQYMMSQKITRYST